MIRSVDPALGHAFNTTGVKRKWKTGLGDQAYGDHLRLSLDCDYPQATDMDIERTSIPSWPNVVIKDIAAMGEYVFCWQPLFVQSSFYPYYEPLHHLKYKIVDVPSLSSSSPSSLNLNEAIVKFDFNGVFVDGDLLAFSWRGVNYSDCNPVNFLGETYTFNHSTWPAIWFGYDSGIHGIDEEAKDELHVCWKSSADNAPDAWIRIKKSTGMQYQFRVNEWDEDDAALSNAKCPELVTFEPELASADLYESDTEI